jgi:hypothetical protein
MEVGDTAVMRYLHMDGRIATAQCGRVIADDDRGLLIWIGPGSQVIERVTLDGAPTRYRPLSDKLHVPLLHGLTSWYGNGVLILTPPATDHAVWWFFADDGAFDGWYVNLQSPVVRWSGGVDLYDYALDVVIRPDRGWAWKDEDEFAERTGHPAYWTVQDGVRIRASGERVIARAEAGEFPFDGAWCDFRPDPDWGPTALPWWWDQNPRTASGEPGNRAVGVFDPGGEVDLAR